MEEKDPERGALMRLLDAWPDVCRRVDRARDAMERNHYYRPYVEAYEAAVSERAMLAEQIDAASGQP
jgi:hypothetical protein